MRILDGRELADFVKERQAKQVRALRQAWKTFPKLVIIVANDNPVIDTYVRLKKVYGEDILIDVDVRKAEQSEVAELIQQLNGDDLVHGIILQLPLLNTSQTDELVNMIAPHKDVDGLGAQARFISATATAIDWLVAGYNVSLRGKKIAIVGHGRLVGAPLAKLWQTADLNVSVYDDTTADLTDQLRSADIVVSATGVPRLIKTTMLAPGVVVIDAGTASEGGVIVGDVDSAVRERQDITITPEKGGVGPLTIAALFDNVITAARLSLDQQPGGESAQP